GIDARHLPSVFTAAQEWSDRLHAAPHDAAALAQVSERVALQHDGIEVSLTVPFATGEEGTAAAQGLRLTRLVPMQMKRRGVEMRLVLHGTPPPARVDRPLLTAVARAHRWAEDLLAGRVPSVGAIARRDRLSDRYVRRVLRLGFLAPTIVEAIVDGRHPETLSAIALTRRIDLPALWSAQEQVLGGKPAAMRSRRRDRHHGESRTSATASSHRELLSPGKVFQDQGLPRNDERPNRPEDQF
ncbi:MAG: hypothetical protein ACHQ4J_09005, partial [Candidatus Binatia bacterium]